MAPVCDVIGLPQPPPHEPFVRGTDGAKKLHSVAAGKSVRPKETLPKGLIMIDHPSTKTTGAKLTKGHKKGMTKGNSSTTLQTEFSSVCSGSVSTFNSKGSINSPKSNPPKYRTITNVTTRPSTNTTTTVTASSRGSSEHLVAFPGDGSLMTRTATPLTVSSRAPANLNAPPSSALAKDELMAVSPLQQTPTARPALKLSSLPSSAQDLYIKTRRRAWKRLPVPDLEEILKRLDEQKERMAALLEVMTRPRLAPSVPTMPSFPVFGNATLGRRRPTVTFHRIHIREFEQTLGDNPAVSYGPAITLDWEFHDMEPLLVDDYEEFRLTANHRRRSVRQMNLNYYQRKNILVWTYGFDENQLQQAEKESLRIQRQRSMTKFLLPLSRLEELFGSLKRKTMRILIVFKTKQANKKKTNTNQHDDNKLQNERRAQEGDDYREENYEEENYYEEKHQDEEYFER